jgi:hypothetical protein
MAKRLLEHNTKHKTQNTKTHNNQHDPPPTHHPAAMPSIAMATFVMASNQGTLALCESVKGARRRVRARHHLFLCLGRPHIPHQNIEQWTCWPW